MSAPFEGVDVHWNTHSIFRRHRGVMLPLLEGKYSIRPALHATYSSMHSSVAIVRLRFGIASADHS